MKLASSFTVLLATMMVASTVALHEPVVDDHDYSIPGAEPAGNGICVDEEYDRYDGGRLYGVASDLACHELCQSVGDTSGNLLGFNYCPNCSENGLIGDCICFWDDNTMPVDPPNCGGFFSFCTHGLSGDGEIQGGSSPSSTYNCYKYVKNTEITGDPHFRTWKDEHFEFHGQCDLVMTSVKNFVEDQGIDLDIHIRTSMVRYWSYIKTAAIRIGNDVLEVEGLSDFSRSYWINYEHNGELTELGGFPVSINENNDHYIIDLDRKFPGQKIQIKTYKEFVSVKIIGADNASFGNAVGITGNFKTGKTLARDGHTEIHDFNDLGLEWQVLPSDGKLFHEMARPQFPELCYLPEDPRGEKTRRMLGESTISVEDAEAACANLKDEFDRKGCIYDILATQDLDMVGAY